VSAFVINPYALKFSPLSLTPALWLDASDSNTLYDATTGGSLVAADGAIARWEDKSGNARHATQGSSGARPLRKTGVINGRDVARFDGSDDFLAVDSMSSFFNGDDTPFSLIAVANTLGNATLKVLFSAGNNTGTDYFNWLGLDASEVTRASRRAVFPDEKNASGGSAWTTDHIITFASSGTTISAWLNGAAIITNADFNVATLGSNINRVSVGALVRASVALPWIGDIAEILVFSSEIATANRENVESYLSQKWGITI
jgi:hypothetical protein